jgi:hypothetical protein
LTKLLIISAIVFILNIPFGYWRNNVRKFSLQWFLAIHIPVPFIVGLRFASELGFAWFTYVFMVSAFFLGQSIGVTIHNRIKKVMPDASSCLIMDITRLPKKPGIDE